MRPSAPFPSSTGPRNEGASRWPAAGYSAQAKKRIFVALALPQDIRRSLEEIQKNLRGSGVDAKWVEPRNIHITLKFLGAVGEDKTQDIERLTQRVSRVSAFEMSLNRIGAFPSLSSPRVIWAGFDDAQGHFATLAKRVEDALTGIGFEKETREAMPHATLARLRSASNRSALREKIEEINRDFRPMTVRVEAITLFESKLNPWGPVYSVLWSLKLAAAIAETRS